MGIPNLGTIEDVELRRAWKHEAQHFTPWLAKHLNHLSKVLGIRLEYEGHEMHVGPYRADIVARNPMDNSRILIENQLEDANLQHLGQVLAYLAGLEATVVVWIARSFDEAHRSAIRWLNDHTTDPFAFFAVQVRVVRIGDSPLAPIFDVLEKPNEWDRRVHDKARRAGLSDLGEFRREFWNHVASRHPEEVKPNYAASNVYHEVEEAKARISLYVYTGGVGIFLVPPIGDDSDFLPRVTPLLKPLRMALKKATSAEEVDLSAHAGMTLEIDPRDRTNWDRMADWLHERRVIYERVLRETNDRTATQS